MKKNFLLLSIALVSLSSIVLTGCEKEDPDAIKMEDVNKGIQLITAKDGKDYEVVDLGPTSGNLWAVCNMGATSPEQTGSFFAWGETEAKNDFGWPSYRWSDDDGVELFKYCLDRDRGKYDGITTLQPEDDAPTQLLGEDWHIPSKQDFNELTTKKNCTAKWCKLNGVGGFLFTSVRKGYEGNSIFIPLAGMNDSDHARFAGQYGWYWCNSLYQDPESLKYSTTEATCVWLEHGDVDNHVVKSRPRRAGLPIRAIYTGSY